MQYRFEDLVELVELNPQFFQVSSDRDGIIPMTDNPPGASEESILAAEAALGVKFPSDFRRYLAKWGNLGWDGVEFFGIVDDNPNAKYSNVEKETQYVRENGALPENYVVIVNEDGDEYICVDVNQPEGAIVTWDFFAQELIDDCYYQPSSFVDYLINEFVSQAEDLAEEVGEPIRWPASIAPSVDPYANAD
ncbi:MAG: SMI1/KNR4 family protein [Thermoguttaceae bacterium]|nr:SMI1/KNR4 family protein [Thermoguttaceae bacterium]